MRPKTSTMESAYLYVRVNTDEQKKTGYSLIEQEERLLAHCDLHRIKVKGIFREDLSTNPTKQKQTSF